MNNMGIEWYEGFDISCDECRMKGESCTTSDQQNNISEELYFSKKRLTEKGWIFDDKNDMVFCCKECQEDYEEEN